MLNKGKFLTFFIFSDGKGRAVEVKV